MSAAFEIRVEWLAAPDVSTPELGATWARYEVWVEGRCATQVEAPDGTYRRSVYGSLYPLAEWVATNWWLLTAHVRPSSVDPRYWTWPNLREQPWLASHNFRGAGDGMAWPNLTVVSEGATTRVHWAADERRRSSRLLFASGGDTWLRSSDVHRALARLVEDVLDRLAEQGLPKTRLAEEWAAVGATDSDEQEFCVAAARLGFDPYAVDQATSEAILRAATEIPGELIDDFFDTAEPTALSQAVAWTKRSVPAAERAAGKAKRPLDDLAAAAAVALRDEFERPWLRGYAMAREVRNIVRVDDTAAFDLDPWIGVATVNAPPGGMQGAAAVNRQRCGFVLGTGVSLTFGRSRALGRVLLRPGESKILLSGARDTDERVARAFAAELLAPASGIGKMLQALGRPDDYALESIARRYGVSPLLVRHQYDNQIADAID